MEQRTKLFLAACAVASSATSVNAEPISLSGLDESQWRYDLTVYAFLPARTKGTSTIAGGSVDLDLDFRDAVDLLDYAMAGRFEAWRDDWGLIFDANYVRLEAGGQLPPGGSVTADIRQKWLGLLGAYRVANSTHGAQNLLCHRPAGRRSLERARAGGDCGHTRSHREPRRRRKLG